MADDHALPVQARLGQLNFGRAAALAWMLFLIIVHHRRDQPRHHAAASATTAARRQSKTRLKRADGRRSRAGDRPDAPQGAALIADEPIPTARRPSAAGTAPTAPQSAASAPVWIYLGLPSSSSSALFPYYWSFLIGVGRRLHAQRPPHVVDPRRQLLANAYGDQQPRRQLLAGARDTHLSARRDPASVVFFSTLAGYAFAKLRFRGSGGLLVFVIATLAVPTQLGVMPLFIADTQFGWTGTLGAVIIPTLVTAFGVFFMRQYLATSPTSSSRPRGSTART